MIVLSSAAVHVDKELSHVLPCDRAIQAVPSLATRRRLSDLCA
jgi:hypothetical protein